MQVSSQQHRRSLWQQPAGCFQGLLLLNQQQ
jgi:hypothetical protein